MKTFFRYKIAVMLLAVLAFAGCQEDEITAPISPDSYPTATITTDFTGSEIFEGDTIKYMIKLDKPMDVPITFSVNFDTLVTKADADEHDIYFDAVVIAPYTTEAELLIIFDKDHTPENVERIRLEVGSFIIGQRYLLNPKTVNPKLDLSIKSKDVEIAFAWDTPNDDIDVYAMDESATNALDYAETGANPETISFGTDIPDGTYYFEIWPYYVEGDSFDYTLTISNPGTGTLETFSGNFDMNATYEAGYAYRVLKIVKSGTTFTYTHLL